MRTGLFLLAGFLILGASVILARLFAENFPAAATWSTAAFLVLWLVLVGFNMYVGVAKAGYSVGEELPVLLVLFAIPALAAALVRWKGL